jgi:hypothetical protein
MATRSSSRVYISDTLIIKACNTPGGSGGVADDLNRTAKRTLQRAQALAPVNNPLNAVHRGGKVGTYKKSFKRYRRGNGHILFRAIYNDAPHAVFVEKGRKSTSFAEKIQALRSVAFIGHYHWDERAGALDYSIRYTYWKDQGLGTGWERFSWARDKRVPGAIRWYPGTRGREGRHVLETAFKWSTAKYVSVGVKRGKVFRIGSIVPPRFGGGGFAG